MTTDAYVTAPELKTYLGITDNIDDTQLDDARDAASRALDGYCHTRFASTISGSTTATARVFAPTDWYCLKVPDFYSLTSIKTDENDDGTYERTWTSSDYELSPPSGVVDHLLGWPYNTIRAVGNYRFPVPRTPMSRRHTVEITAQWGWAAVPEPVRQACLQVAAEIFRRKDAPFGVVQTVEFGPLRLSADSVRAVSSLLAPYVRRPVMVG